MVCLQAAFHENDRNHENNKNNEDNSDSYKQGVECWIRGNHGNCGHDENYENPGCKPRVPQTTGSEILEVSVWVLSQEAKKRSHRHNFWGVRQIRPPPSLEPPSDP